METFDMRDDWAAESDWLEQVYQDRADIFDALGFEITEDDLH